MNISLPRRLVAVAGVALALTSSGASHAQFFSYYQWTNPQGGSYESSSSWSPTGVPDADFEGAVFNLDDDYTISSRAPFQHSVGTFDVTLGHVTLSVYKYTSGGLRLDALEGNPALLTVSDGILTVQGTAAIGSN